MRLTESINGRRHAYADHRDYMSESGARTVKLLDREDAKFGKRLILAISGNGFFYDSTAAFAFKPCTQLAVRLTSCNGVEYFSSYLFGYGPFCPYHFKAEAGGGARPCSSGVYRMRRRQKCLGIAKLSEKCATFLGDLVGYRSRRMKKSRRDVAFSNSAMKRSSGSVMLARHDLSDTIRALN
jgi:hypothetical protein